MCLKRSKVRARLTKEESCIRVLEEKVAALEAWRPDIEQRIEKRELDVDENFKLINDRIEAFKGEVKEQNSVCSANHALNDNRHDDVMAILENNQRERAEIMRRVEDESVRLTDISSGIEE